VGVKKGLKRSISRILDKVDVDILLLAHGEPLVGGTGKLLRSFVEGPGAR
jgi:hypothetical protein